MRATIFLLTVGFLAFSGCFLAESNINTAALRGPYRIEVYKSGMPVADRSVEVGSAKERAVVKWLTSHSQGWSPSLVTYAPGRRLIGEGFNLNVSSDGLCVLNHRTDQGDAWEQVVKRLSSEESAELMALLDLD